MYHHPGNGSLAIKGVCLICVVAGGPRALGQLRVRADFQQSRAPSQRLHTLWVRTEGIYRIMKAKCKGNSLLMYFSSRISYRIPRKRYFSFYEEIMIPQND